MSHETNEEYGKNFDVEKLERQEIDGDAWLLGDPIKIVNVKGENFHTVTHSTQLQRE
jgi:hypothetical protein